MVRVNAYGEISNDLGQSQSVGGMRGNASRVSAWLNTDNRKQSNCALRVSAEVHGERQADGRPRKTCHKCGRRWAESQYDREKREYTVKGDEALTQCPLCGALRQGRDTRETHFRIGLPSSPEGCTIHLEVGSPGLRDLAFMGLALCGLKAAQHSVKGEHKKSRGIREFIHETLAELKSEAEPTLDAIMLPGGVSVAHALACVKIVQGIAGGDGAVKDN